MIFITGWLVYDSFEAERNKHYIDMYIKYGFEKKINIKLIYIERLSFGIKENKPFLLYDGDKPEKPDFVVVRTVFPYLNKHFEIMGIPVFNNSFVSDICNDKHKTYQYLSEHNVKIMDTWFVKKNEISNHNFKYPVILKPSGGKGGKNVFLIQNESELKEKVEIINDNIIIQKVASDIGKDLRVYIIGKKIIASMLRVSNKDFRSNYCLSGNAYVYNLNEEEKSKVEKIIGLFDFGLVGVDFIFDKGKIVFNEIEDVVGARMLYDKTKINIVRLYLDYILSVI